MSHRGPARTRPARVLGVVPAGLAAAALVTLGACSSSTDAGADPGGGGGAAASGQQYPDVKDATVTCEQESCSVEATISSPYDSPERYADAFRVLTTDREELGTRELLHDHASEQPFTRSLAEVTIPAEVSRVIVQGHDQENGWGGAEVTVDVPR